MEPTTTPVSAPQPSHPLGIAESASELRVHLEALIAPNGLTRTNVSQVARWFNGPIYWLLDAHEAALHQIGEAA